MTEVTIPGIGHVTFPESMSLADIETAARGLSSRVGSDRKGGYNADLAMLDRQMTNTQPGVAASQSPQVMSLPLGAGNVSIGGMPGRAIGATGRFLDKNITPAVVGATIGSIAMPELPAAAALLRYAPQILGAGAGGGGAAALEEAQNPASTPGSIAQKGLVSGLQMAGSEVAGIGASAALNKLMAPNVTFLRKVSEKAQEAVAFLPDTVSRFIAGIPEGSATRAAVDTSSNFIRNSAEGVTHLIHAADKFGTLGDLAQGHLAAAAFGGPVGWGLAAAKQLIDPGALMRYLTKETTSDTTKAVTRQLVTGGIRASLGSNEPFFDPSQRLKNPAPSTLKQPNNDQINPLLWDQGAFGLDKPLSMEGRASLLPLMRTESGVKPALPGMLASMVNALTFPSRAMEGSVPQSQMVPEALNTAMNVSIDSWATSKAMGNKAIPPTTEPSTTVGAQVYGEPLSQPLNSESFARVKGPISDPTEGYVYHATNADRALEIKESGELVPHGPSYGTDQSIWPDGSKSKRSYFTATPSNTWQFAPEDGKPVLLRIPKTDSIKRESTSDLYTTGKIPAQHIEYLGADGAWHPLVK